MASVLVLGGGFGGVAAACELRATLPADDQVTLVASSDHFFVGFAKLWDLVGARALKDGSASLRDLGRRRIRFVRADVTGVDPEARVVATTEGEFAADGLVVALGAGFAPAHTALLGPGAHNLYDAGALPDIRTDLARLEGGRLVVSILGTPYLCPPAPYEAALLLDEWLRARGRREDVEMAVSTPQPLTLPVAGPDASRYLADRLGERDIALHVEQRVEGVDHEAGSLRFSGGDSLDWGLLLTVPAAVPPPVLADCPLAGESGWVEPDPRTFRTAFDRVYAAGDCTMVPTATAQLPKAGVFAEAGGTTAARNLAADLHGGAEHEFDGHGHCYMELPGQRVARVHGNFYAQPRPDVALEEPSEEAFRAKQAWEQERLTGWFA